MSASQDCLCCSLQSLALHVSLFLPVHVCVSGSFYQCMFVYLVLPTSVCLFICPFPTFLYPSLPAMPSVFLLFQASSFILTVRSAFPPFSNSACRFVMQKNSASQSLFSTTLFFLEPFVRQGPGLLLFFSIKTPWPSSLGILKYAIEYPALMFLFIIGTVILLISGF